MSLKYDSTILVDGDEPTNRALLDLLKKINEVSAVAEAARTAAIEAITPPIGYVYTQGPDDMSPSDLWPTATWENVSSEEAGSFRRYEGGAASAFGAGQQLDAFETHIHNWNYGAGGAVSGFTASANAAASSPVGQVIPTTAPVVSGGTPRVASETRPVNYTVRKWRRTA